MTLRFKGTAPLKAILHICHIIHPSSVNQQRLTKVKGHWRQKSRSLIHQTPTDNLRSLTSHIDGEFLWRCAHICFRVTLYNFGYHIILLLYLTKNDTGPFVREHFGGSTIDD